MANQIQDTKLRCCILVIIALSPLLCNKFVYGRTIAATKNTDLFKHKGTIKTIESENGDKIDCVDIYQQPAFDHPALKNHTLQKVPYANYPSSIAGKSNKSEVFQGLFKTVECPEGTIPIKQIQKDAIPQRIHAIPRQGIKSTDAISRIEDGNYEYVMASMRGDKYDGASATLNVWNPKVESVGEHSLAFITIRSGPDNDPANSLIEAGWRKDTPIDNILPKFYIYWTDDANQNTGCNNLECPGFVQTNSKFNLDTTFSPVSTYNNIPQKEVTIRIEKNTNTGHWWLHLQNTAIGYWPDTIFTSLKGSSANGIDWGGEVYDSKSSGHHTTTQMGSGHFSSEGFGRASYISNLAYIDADIKGIFINVTRKQLSETMTSSSCYDLQIGNSNNIFYGGPGYSTTCP